MKRHTIKLIFISILCLTSHGCGKVLITHQTLIPVDRLDSINRDEGYLLAHMDSGNLYIFSDWIYIDSTNTLLGTGVFMDHNRAPLGEGPVSISIDSVSIFESNEIVASGSNTAITALTAVTTIIGVACLSNPKACFGSCPTFYNVTNDDEKLIAEGFSSSISPSLEDEDIDALYGIKAYGNTLKILMKNEAYETHVVRRANILYAEHEDINQVFAAKDGDFYLSDLIYEPIRCRGPEGNCLEVIKYLDGEERLSESDGVDLANTETIELEFNDLPKGDYGLVIASRQTLLSTFLFYQQLAYMGKYYGGFLASLERGDEMALKSVSGMGEILGGIDVLLPKNGSEWKVIGKDIETGPIATDIRLVPLPKSYPLNKINLRMAKGNIRIDYIALVRLKGKVRTHSLNPVSLLFNGVERADLLDKLNNEEEFIVSMPGDDFVLSYELPTNSKNLSLFLDTKGYYLEWLRDKWLEEENLNLAIKTFKNPSKMLKYLAPAFKEIEPEMEAIFWNSKYEK